MRTSILIAAHNEGDALWQTVRSCVETCAGLDYEIIVADDASTDDSVEQVRRRFPHIRVVCHDERRGAAPTKDLGAREARGDVFVFLDGHCNPDYGAIARLAADVEETKGKAVITPAIAGLDVRRWRNSGSQVGHGYFLDLENFHCGWLPLAELRVVDVGRRRFYESPALIGCALAVSRELYEDLWGFDRNMRMWGVEDLDFGLKSWLMGRPILHDPEAVVGHRFRSSFDNYDVPVEHTVVNQLRMARKNFTQGVWSDWVDRCRLAHSSRLPDHPEGLWARVWQLFEEQRASVEQERGYLMARRQRDEFWYAERFGLTWPRLRSAPSAASTIVPAPMEAQAAMAMSPSPSPSPPPGPPIHQPGFCIPGQPMVQQPSCQGGCAAFGVPQWSLNLFSLNLILRDTPAFYTPGLGPKIAWTLTFNSQDPNAGASPFNYLFGAGVWCSYQTHVIDLGTEAHVVMPDGREDYYYPVDLSANPVVYTPAVGMGVYNQLTKNTTTNQFQLALTDHTALTFGQPFIAGGVSYYAVTQIADNVGNTVALGYTSGAIPKLSTVTDANGNVSNVVYNSAGQASQVNDPFGANVQFSYTTTAGLTRLASLTDQAGYTSLLAYDANAQLISLTTPLTAPNPTWQFAYSGAIGQISAITGPDGQTTNYGTTSTTTTVTDPLGRQTTYDFSNNSFGGPGQTTDALGNTTQRQFDADRNVTRLINARGYFSDFTYDSQGNRLTELDYLNAYPDTSLYIALSWTYDANSNVLSATDAAGTESWTYNANNQILTHTDKLGHTETNTYTGQGSLQTFTDRNGNVAVTNTYDSNNRLISTADALGNKTLFQWDSRGRRIAATDPNGNTTSYAYDLLDRLTITTFPDSTTTQNSYNCCILTQTIDQRGGVTQFVYDDYNRPVQRIEAYGTPLQRTTTTSYDAVGNVLTVTNPRGTVTNYSYDALNRRVQQIDAYGTPLQRATTTAYDAVGNVLSITNAVGATTQYVYDALNRQTQVIEAYNSPVQRTTTKTYDALGNVLSITNPRGVVTNYVYDALGRQIQQIDAYGTPLQRTTTTTYDPVGNVLSTTNSLGVVTNYTYDARNLRLTQVDAYGTPLQRTLAMAYDANGNLTQTIDALGYTTTYGYDALNRPIQVQNPDGGTTTTAYDANGNVLTETDPLGHSTTNVYDALNRKTQSTDARGGVVQWVYDANNNLRSLTDPVDNVTQWVYDALDRKVQEIDPLSNGSTFAYDAIDRMTSAIDRNGQSITSSYDLLNRKTGEIWYNSSGVQVNTLTFSFDANDNLLTATNNVGMNTMTYDVLDRTAMVQGPFGTTLTYTYDAADNRTLVQDSFGAATTRIYDVLDRVTSLQLGGTGQTPLREDFAYTPRDQAATQTRYSDLAGTNKIGSSTFGYDSVGRLTTLQHLDGGGANIASYLNAYDLASRITSETLNGGTPTNYTYDAADELTNDGLTVYSYDLNGNRTMPGYTTGPANELTSDGVWNYVHDKNGNLIGKTNISTGETWNFGYDNRNRLISAQQTTASGIQMQAAYVYDALGKRIEKDVTQSGVTTATRFAYDGGEIWADLTAANALQTRYIRGDEVLELLAQIASSGAAAWMLTDRMGSVRNVVDNSGAVIDAVTYDGYGNITNETASANGGAYKYGGYRLDRESGLYRPDPSKGRLYYPAAGIWNGRDAREFPPGDFNLYRYVGNNPTNSTDPSGNAPPVSYEDYKKCWEHLIDAGLEKALSKLKGGEGAIKVLKGAGCFGGADTKAEVIKNCMSLLCSLFTEAPPPCAVLVAGQLAEKCGKAFIDAIARGILPDTVNELVEGWENKDCKFTVYSETCLRCCRAKVLADPCLDIAKCESHAGCSSKPSVLNK